MFNETVYRLDDDLSGLQTGLMLPASAVQSINAQTQATWKKVLGAIGTAGLTALTNSINSPSQTPSGPIYIQSNARAEQELAALREALSRQAAADQEEEKDSSNASFSWTKDGLRLGGGATLSPTMLVLIAGGLYLLFKEPPRRGR